MKIRLCIAAFILYIGLNKRRISVANIIKFLADIINEIHEKLYKGVLINEK